ncbi:MarR family winged helix-turn-helix transcriptional regulator [Nocardioides sp. cx-173]|uniref:MarR family winged helix-turn-helix transcriptional regulator n=1 Tax=Nocardioides sp. cx-173 TaxID=2898796 RepID=UPI001E5AC1C6|nr:MarR family winged helix-turn-helix transcriptional regulator [Nocardioides sp. cx-173]MCD4527221.1 MarR family winged helix-turn-helix transcriptional regulator [Nocardioides sp. cx-173]UGB40422.1 MarR family winged helix-turn-helix transcriptional regulator [Nocardioides sp. cx-173]
MSESDDLRLYATFTRLVRVQTQLWNGVDQRVRRRHGVALTHVTVLQVVAETDGCRVQDIVSALHISVGGASKAVDRLVAAGHVVRTVDPQDRRSSLLEVTAAGRRLLGDVVPDLGAELGRRLGARLPAADLAELDRILRALQSEEVGA